MGKTLVLAEKPSVGREIARVLGCKNKGNGCLIGKNYIVTWALGHLVTLADPEHYGDQYKTWSLDMLPMIPRKMDLVVIKETGKQFHCVKTLMKDPQVGELVIATDAGREGELVARWIIEKVGFHKPIKRLWISSQTDRAILDGFASLKPAKMYDHLYQSAVCRAEADWLVGLNVTRALTCRFNAQLSAGRVQTPTLAMIVEREREIRKFVPKEYDSISADFGKFTGLWRDKNNNTRLFDREKAQALLEKLKGATFCVTAVNKTIKKEGCPLLYDLTELQRDANKKYGYSAKQTLSAMQRLYETHKLLTYPRTDSRYLTEDIVPTLGERLKSIAVGPYAKLAGEIIREKRKIAKKCVDNKKVTDHHAIIPTEEYVELHSLSVEERNVYDLVVRRFLCVFCGDCEYEAMNVEVTGKEERFGAKGKHMVKKGWRSAYDRISEEEEDEDEKDQELPALRKGESLSARSLQLKTGKTKPPARYTEATLLSAMEHPGKFIDDAKMRDVIEKSSGLGTPATRAEIIERLFNAFYTERHGKEIIPTSKGMQLIDLVPEDLKEPELTAKWEQTLEKIARGTADSKKFMEDIKRYAEKLIGMVVANDAKYTHDNVSGTRCPNCGKYMLEVNGKKGKLLVCQDRECGYRQNVSIRTNSRCPNCHKILELVGSGDGRTYVCKCGYREKESAFRKRMAENKAGNVSKKEVQRYLKSQNAQPELSPFDLALQKAMEKK